MSQLHHLALAVLAIPMDLCPQAVAAGTCKVVGRSSGTPNPALQVNNEFQPSAPVSHIAPIHISPDALEVAHKSTEVTKIHNISCGAANAVNSCDLRSLQVL